MGIMHTEVDNAATALGCLMALPMHCWTGLRVALWMCSLSAVQSREWLSRHRLLSEASDERASSLVSNLKRLTLPKLVSVVGG